jgi:peptidoglycan/LPS O-acetylase OafA/YrhL
MSTQPKRLAFFIVFVLFALGSLALFASRTQSGWEDFTPFLMLGIGALLTLVNPRWRNRARFQKKTNIVVMIASLIALGFLFLFLYNTLFKQLLELTS